MSYVTENMLRLEREAESQDGIEHESAVVELELIAWELERQLEQLQSWIDRFGE